MSSPDPLQRIAEQSRIARSAIAEAQRIVAECIAVIERGCAAPSGARTRHDERAEPPFPPPP